MGFLGGRQGCRHGCPDSPPNAMRRPLGRLHERLALRGSYHFPRHRKAIPMKRILATILLLGLVACGPTHKSLDQIDPYESEDQKTLDTLLATLQQTLNDRDVDGWLALYSEDAIITYTKNRPTPKQAVMEDVHAQDLSTWNFQITDIRVVSSEIQADTATVQAILMMKTGSRTRPHPETHYFDKRDGTWLITKETNP
jgi:hypothetical protein